VKRKIGTVGTSTAAATVTEKVGGDGERWLR
jgi:hypothetical protein